LSRRLHPLIFMVRAIPPTHHCTFPLRDEQTCNERIVSLGAHRSVMRRHHPGVRRYGRVHLTAQVIYVITSLPPDKLDPAALLQLSGDHGTIENRLFHVRDVTFGEDACRVRSGSAPRALASAAPSSRSSNAPARRQDPPAKPSPSANGLPSASS